MGGGVGACRRWWLVVAGVVGLVVAGWCWNLTASLLEQGEGGAERATVLALPTAISSLLATVMSLWLTWRGSRPGLDIDRVARDLARAVRVERQRFLDQALAVAWEARPARVQFRDPEAADLPARVETLLLKWRATLGAEAGSIDDVAAFYQEQSNGRLVVLGAPGAGKTVLLSRLVLDLLNGIEASATGDLPRQAAPIPVLLSLPSCDLDDPRDASSDQLADRLQAWITRRLIEDYGLRPAQAVALVHARRVLPVLDGLDEMDPAPTESTTDTVHRPRARAVLRALNASDRPPVVLACRQLDYSDISQPVTDQAASVSVLADARHVMLRPLEAKDVIGYLTERFHGRDGHLRPRWQPVADALHAGAPLLQVLANPWQLFLAVTAYTAENSDPADLLTMNPDHIETHLLANLIPAVTEDNETAARHGWTSERITSWLMTIAAHQYHHATENGESQTDIYLPGLWCVAERRYPRWIPAILNVTLLLAMVVGGLSLATDLVWRVVGIASILPAVLLGSAAFNPVSQMRRFDTAAVRTPHGRRRLRNILAATTLVGVSVCMLAFGLVERRSFGLAEGLTDGLLVGLGFGLAAGLVRGLSDDVEGVHTATALARQCITYSIAVGLLVGLGLGLGIGLVLALAVGLDGLARAPALLGLDGLALALAFALALALTLALTLGYGNVWLRYVLGIRAAAHQGILPKRPAWFLDWCLDTGLMRMAGNAIQFRHRQLQDWLTPAPHRYWMVSSGGCITGPHIGHYRPGQGLPMGRLAYEPSPQVKPVMPPPSEAKRPPPNIPARPSLP